MQDLSMNYMFFFKSLTFYKAELWRIHGLFVEKPRFGFLVAGEIRKDHPDQGRPGSPPDPAAAKCPWGINMFEVARN